MAAAKVAFAAAVLRPGVRHLLPALSSAGGGSAVSQRALWGSDAGVVLGGLPKAPGKEAAALLWRTRAQHIYYTTFTMCYSILIMHKYCI